LAAVVIEACFGTSRGWTETIKGLAGALVDVAIGVAETRAAIPTQTTMLAASRAIATIFKCVARFALHIEEFMAVTPVD
jgi:hypothetical protein